MAILKSHILDTQDKTRDISMELRLNICYRDVLMKAMKRCRQNVFTPPIIDRIVFLHKIAQFSHLTCEFAKIQFNPFTVTIQQRIYKSNLAGVS